MRLPDRVTFTETIAPIVYDNCVTCHRPGEAAPFSLISYTDVKNRGQLIAAVTQSRYMPPWQATHGFGDFDGRAAPDGRADPDDRDVGEERDAGRRQVEDAGAAEVHQRLEARDTRTWCSRCRQEFEVPASGPDIFRNFVIPSRLLEDKWVRAVEFRPGARTVVHHALFAYVRSGAYAKIDGADGKPGFRGLAPIGANPASRRQVRSAAGRWARARASFPRVSRCRWAKGPTSSSRCTSTRPAKRSVRSRPSGSTSPRRRRSGRCATCMVPGLFGIGSLAEIPAGERNHVIERSTTLPVDVKVYFANPHAHYLAKEFKATATLPDGSTKPLLWIQDWDFNWQDGYNYKQPIMLPKGTRIDVRITYDNSATNPRNPSNPPQRVWWGEQSTDEMGTIGFGLIPVRLEDEAAWNQFAAQQQNGTLLAAVTNGTLQRVAESQGIDLQGNPGIQRLLGLARGRGAAATPPAGSTTPANPDAGR